MTDVPWTPGPWVISGKGSIRGPNAPRQILGYIARVNWQNRDANARLIADAPAMAEVLDGTTGAFLAVLLENLAARLVMLGTAEDDDLVVEARHRAAKTRAILARIKGATP